MGRWVHTAGIATLTTRGSRRDQDGDRSRRWSRRPPRARPLATVAPREHVRHGHRSRDRHHRGPPDALGRGADRGQPGASGRRRQGAGPLRLLLRRLGRRDAVGSHPALAPPPCPDPADRSLGGVADPRRRDGHHRRGRPWPAHLRPHQPGPAGVRHRRRALRGRARGGGGRRPPRDLSPRPRGHRRGVRGAGPAHRSRGRHRRHRGAHPPRRQRVAPPAHRPRRRRRHGRCHRRGHLHDRHAGPGVPRSGGRTRPARQRGRGRRAVHRHPVAPRGPQADRRLPRPARGAGAPDVGRCRRRVRGPGGHQPPGAHLPAGLAHRASGEDPVRPPGELPGPRPPPPGHHLDAAPRHRRRPSGQDRGPLRLRRRGLRQHVVGRAVQRHHPHPGSVPVRQRRRRRVRGAHQQPPVRRDAGLRCGAGLLRPREPDGPPGRGLRARPRRGAAPQRHADR